MATPKPGEIRCPTCHRSTPPAAFCTQCGSAIPSDARIRPRGMDRDELQERIRARRSGGEPYRRGGLADDEPGGYGRFEPEPGDANIRRPGPSEGERRDHLADAPRAADAAERAPERRDVTREHDDWVPPAAPAAGAAAAGSAAAADTVGDDRYPAHVDNYDDAAYDDAAYPYEYDEWDEPRERRGGGAPAILGFLALGVLALLGGAVLAGVFSEDPGTGRATPTPSASVAIESAAPASTAPSAAPTEQASAAPSGAPSESGEPVTFPDGFTAEAQPCLPGSAGQNGCDSNGSVNGGATDIWIGFSGGSADDVVGAALLNEDGEQVADGSIELSRIGCGVDCRGYTRFNFSNLPVGTYTVEVTRNGDLADRVTFEVE
ncbi:MAG: hypothetical protein ACR2I5_07190 [Candidatus Limnocylindria bacterium]